MMAEESLFEEMTDVEQWKATKHILTWRWIGENFKPAHMFTLLIMVVIILSTIQKFGFLNKIPSGSLLQGVMVLVIMMFTFEFFINFVNVTGGKLKLFILYYLVIVAVLIVMTMKAPSFVPELFGKETMSVIGQTIINMGG